MEELTPLPPPKRNPLLTAPGQFENTSTQSLLKLRDGLEAVVTEAAADHGVVTCALLLGLVRHELVRRKDSDDVRLNT